MKGVGEEFEWCWGGNGFWEVENICGLTDAIHPQLADFRQLGVISEAG